LIDPRDLKIFTHIPVIRFSFAVLCILLFCGQVCSQDCTLAGYLERGVSHSPELKDLAGQILTNQYDSLIVRATYLPQVNFNASMMVAPAINGWGYSEAITNGQSLFGTLNVNQQLFNNKTREANLEKVGLESGNLVINRKIGLNDLKKAITAQYLSAYAALEERRFQQDVRETMVKVSGVLKAWTEKGIYHQTDYLLLQVEMLNIDRNIRDLDLQYRKELWNLDLICGISDTTTCDLKLPVIADTSAGTVESSLFFKRFMLDSLLIRNEQVLIDRKYKPVMNWFADAGLVNNEPRYIYQNFGMSIGLSMTLPVFDGNQRRMNYEKIRIHEATRKNYEENFRFRYHAQLHQMEIELEKTIGSLKENEKQVSLVTQLIAAYKVLLNDGSVPIGDYILALRNLIEAKHAGLLYRIRTQYIINEINFWRQ